MTSLFEDLKEGLNQAIAFENGRTHPTGPAYRLLEILEQGREAECSFVTMDE